MSSASSDQNVLLRRLKWLMSTRLVLALIAIFAILISRYRPESAPSPFKVYNAYYILLFACIINLVYLLVLYPPVKMFRAANLIKLIAVVQISIDVVLIACLVYLTGGVDSVFAYLFFASILAGAMLISARAGILLASAATVSLCAVNILYYLHKAQGIELPFLSPDITEGFDKRLYFLLPYLFFFSLSLHLVAVLAGILSKEIEKVRIVTDEILDNMAEGVLAADKDGRIVFVNGQFMRLLGLSEGTRSLVGKPFSSVPAIALNTEIDAALSGKDPRSSFEFQTTDQDGKETVLELNRSVIQDDRGNPRGSVIVLADLSMRIKMEKAVKHAEMLQAIGEMSAGLAHEIRNPLSSIRGAAQELGRGNGIPESDQKMLSIIVKESDRLNSIISGFFEFARKKTTNYAWFNLSALIEETAIMLEKREDARVKIVRDLAPGLEYFGDQEQIKQSMLNLCINAIEASKPGSNITIKAFLSKMPALSGPSLNGMIVEIVDSGNGIPPEAMDKLYTPFFTTKPKGTGMGLCISDKIIRSHNGNISMQSMPGKGTTASVWLPLASLKGSAPKGGMS